MSSHVDIKDFAIRVERLCDFLLRDAMKDGSPDIVVIQTLKEDAADLQLGSTEYYVSQTIEGLSDFMKGVSKP